MNIALARSEIAQFFDCHSQTVEGLWTSSALARSVYVEHRAVAELSHSSIFDVLEHYLRTDLLGPSPDDGEVETWLAAVDEFVEADGWTEASTEDMVFCLMKIYLDFTANPCPPEILAMRSTATLLAYISLLGFVESDAEATTLAQQMH